MKKIYHFLEVMKIKTKMVAGVKCCLCGKEIKTENLNISPNEFAKKSGWYIMTIESKDTWEVDYLCSECYDNLLMKFLDEK